MEKEYYEAQVKYINEIRSIRHDIQAHMIVLQYYLESENYEKAKAYLGEMKRNQQRDGLLFPDTGHDLVNAIVNDILACSQKEILFEVSGLLPPCFSMTEYDTCTLFANAFSNACEACEKLEKIKPVIRMEVQETKDTCTIVISNPIEWKVKTDKTGLLTTKEDKEHHGFGVKNMVQVVKKYEGNIEFLIVENKFLVKITHYNV